MKNLPKARTANLLEQNIGKEVMLYDLITDKAYNLNESLTIVYKACSDKQTFAELKRNHKFTDDFIYFALDELNRNNLLADAADYRSPFSKMNRREVVKKVGLTTAVALPVILSLTAPKAARAVSGIAACRGAVCSCSVPNDSGGPALCGEDLGGTSTNCRSSVGEGCDCGILASGTMGECVVFGGGV